MLYMEKLGGTLSGIEIGQGTLTVTHFLYANDILVSCKVDKAFVEAVRDIFECFGEWSTLQMNANRSNTFFSPKTERNSLQQIKRTISV